MRRTETPKPISIKFCTVEDIPDIVTYTNFGDHRLRGFWVAAGQISPTSIDFHRRPYNTLALPCERVIHQGIFQWKFFCKSVKIWQNYGHEFVASLFGAHRVYRRAYASVVLNLNDHTEVADSRVRWKVQISGKMQIKRSYFIIV